ncbi:MAG: carbohydrate ABC transporter permease [Candidatus Rifleibacteriota bacterium]
MIFKRRPVGPVRRAQRTLLFLSPWLITFAVFWLYPLIFSLILSFCDYNVFHPDVFRFVGFKNYLRLFSDPEFYQAFKNTLIFVLGTTPVTTVLALALALLVNSVAKGTQFFRSAFFLPSIISIVVTATIFKSFYSPVGMLNRILEFFSLPGHAWLIEKGLALPAIMFMNIWAYTGYYMVLYLAALKAVPGQLYEAADVDGASDWQKFRYITLPQIHYMTIFILIVNSIRTWQVFPEIFTLTRGGPVGTTNSIVHLLYESAFRYHEMGYASALAYILLFIIMIFSIIQMKMLSGRKT